MKNSAKFSILCVFFSIIFMVVGTAKNSFSAEYDALKGLESVKAVFDFELGNPQMALLHLQVIDQTFKDKNLQISGKKPDVVVVFIGPSVKLVSQKKSEFNAADQKIVGEIANTISKMTQDGVKFEICLVAAKLFGVDPSSILPEVKKVGNGWISLIGYQSRGYALVRVSS